MAIVMFALCLTICEIFTKLIKCQKHDLENQGQGGEKWTCAIRLDMFDSIWTIFFRIFATWEHTFTQKGNTHTANDRSDDYRQNLQSRFA